MGKITESSVELTGGQLAGVLFAWFGRVVPAERGLALQASFPPEDEWEAFEAARADALHRQLLELSRMETIDDMEARIASWDDDLVIALNLRLARRAELLASEFGKEDVFSGPGRDSFLTMTKAGIRLALAPPTP